MPSYKSAFGSYLKTDDLQGRQTKVVVESVGMEEVKSDDGKENKLVIRFHGKDKGLILNRTNCELLEQITGSEDYDAWVGAAVMLYPTTTRFGNKTVPCLRIKQIPTAAVPRIAASAVGQAPRSMPVEEYVPDERRLTSDDDIPF
jgi:hypothetical protein